MVNEMVFTDKQVAEMESLARVMTDPLVSDEDKQLLAGMLCERHDEGGRR